MLQQDGETKEKKKEWAARRLFSSRTVAEAAWGSGDAHVPPIYTRQSRLQAVGAHGALVTSLASGNALG